MRAARSSTARVTVLGTFPGALPLDAGIDELAPRTSTCVAFNSAADSGLVIASLDDGSIVAEATADMPMLPSVDGCTVVASTESRSVGHRSERADRARRRR